MYQLKDGPDYSFGRTDRLQEKEDHNVYLKMIHWEFLDRRAEERGVSRNQVLRDILDTQLVEDGADREEAALTVLEEIHDTATSEEVQEAVDQIQEAILRGEVRC
ncbi:MAG: hypothetical protein SVW02_03435 [Candidatus Nanohaloarchaea archaeon]|nr:hypothetical protein [Candidatus Nanohaloarchaea archaeon]